jgi:hypothetical protein
LAPNDQHASPDAAAAISNAAVRTRHASPLPRRADAAAESRPVPARAQSSGSSWRPALPPRQYT